jgi:hypothetical protein
MDIVLNLVGNLDTVVRGSGMADTFLAVVHDDGNWSIVSYDQSRTEIEYLQKQANDRGCRLVRLPCSVLEGFSMTKPLDLSLAEEVPCEVSGEHS